MTSFILHFLGFFFAFLMFLMMIPCFILIYLDQKILSWMCKIGWKHAQKSAAEKILEGHLTQFNNDNNNYKGGN